MTRILCSVLCSFSLFNCSIIPKVEKSYFLLLQTYHLDFWMCTWVVICVTVTISYLQKLYHFHTDTLCSVNHKLSIPSFTQSLVTTILIYVSIICLSHVPNIKSICLLVTGLFIPCVTSSSFTQVVACVKIGENVWSHHSRLHLRHTRSLSVSRRSVQDPWVSHMCGRELTTWAISCCVLEGMRRKSDLEADPGFVFRHFEMGCAHLKWHVNHCAKCRSWKRLLLHRLLGGWGQLHHEHSLTT